jgi:hypothetical protein
MLGSEAGLAHGNILKAGWDTDFPYGSGQPKFVLIRFSNIFGGGAGQLPVGSTILSATLTYVVGDMGDPANINEVAFDWQENVIQHVW